MSAPQTHLRSSVEDVVISSCVQVPLRGMESREHQTDGEGLGTGTRTCHMSTAIWTWELVVMLSG